MKVGLDGYLREKVDGKPKVWNLCKNRITILVPDFLIGKKVFIKVESADVKEDKESNKEYESFGVKD